MNFYILSQAIETATPSAKTANDSFGLYIYIILSFLYIMIIHFAINIDNEFNLIQMILFFIFAGILGYLFLGYEIAFVIGIVLSLIFISGPKIDL